MRQSSISDDHTIINTQGIRFVEKIDVVEYGREEPKYVLRVTYKGDVLRYDYRHKQDRDAQFHRLREALEPAGLRKMGSVALD